MMQRLKNAIAFVLVGWVIIFVIQAGVLMLGAHPEGDIQSPWEVFSCLDLSAVINKPWHWAVLGGLVLAWCALEASISRADVARTPPTTRASWFKPFENHLFFFFALFYIVWYPSQRDLQTLRRTAREEAAAEQARVEAEAESERQDERDRARAVAMFVAMLDVDSSVLTSAVTVGVRDGLGAEVLPLLERINDGVARINSGR